MLKRTALFVLLFPIAALELYVCIRVLPYRWHGTSATSPLSDGLFLLSIFVSFALVASGAIGFVSPESIQNFRLTRNRTLFPANAFRDPIKTASYIRSLRFAGLLAFIVGIFLAFLFVKRFFELVFI